MKRLYIVGGPMGVGKTAVCRVLQSRLPDAVFLDGDWCWDARPFHVTDETVAVAMDNIRHMLNNYLRCSAWQSVIFCWVLHRQSIADEILSGLDLTLCEVIHVNLICDEATLIARLSADIGDGIRTEGVIERSLERLPLYAAQSVPALDTSALTVDQAAEAILEMRDGS